MISGPAGLGAAAPSGIGEVLVSSRSFAEYEAMFALTGADLHQRILDCPGGASGFTAQACAAGARARACDPLYRLEPQELARIAVTNRQRGEQYVRTHPDEYEWSFFADPAEYLRQRSASAAAFVEDYRAHRERYVAASLPALPFGDGEFDLALCSHLLFAYADRLDLTFHAAAIRELVRIAGQVRIFPVFTMGAAPALDLDPLRTLLAGQGIGAALVGVDYAFQKGEPAMLVCSRD